jgi:hypothetical protein
MTGATESFRDEILHLIHHRLVELEVVLWSESSVSIDRRLRLRAPGSSSTTTATTPVAIAAGGRALSGSSAAPRRRAAAGGTAAPATARQEVLAAGGGCEDLLGGGRSRARTWPDGCRPIGRAGRTWGDLARAHVSFDSSVHEIVTRVRALSTMENSHI